MLRSFKQDPSWKHEAPPMPRWRLERDLEEARRVYQEYIAPWVGKPLTAQTRALLSQELADVYGEATPKTVALSIQDCLLAESAYPLTMQVGRRIALQMVCAEGALFAGVPIPRFISVTKDNTWLPMEITSVTDLVQQGRGLRKQLNLLVIGGEFAGFELAKNCPCGYLSHLAYDLGYSKARPYEDQEGLVGLWLAGLAERSPGQDLVFDKYWLSTAMSKHNRALVKARVWTEAELLEGTQDTLDE